jgi:hypothetical protein
MEYESSPERLSTNPSSRVTGKKVAKEKRDLTVELLKDGVGTNAVVAQTGLTKQTVIAIKKDTEDNKGFDLGSWKKNTSALLSQIVTKGSVRLLDAIEDIPAGQLPLAIAILVDKVAVLQDAPTVVVEHRLKVTHHDINKMLRGDIIDIPPDKVLPLTE